ncbi:hypothetical protein SISSUDRAFT_1124961 [Sistotremastrum suecicum HHB10207 ss-3]|uniref:BHLH domain-containing protein n=1 Tax=Sistotremastrum suecicum HHB10207 ss-3 TaxID=1314776 RepID=A0A166I6I8_9AGAM|nr:hypothetical protein SISSUDRAFT_1124961 [Sistotremastrum suecicum HHB10207 ss-3]
MSSSVDPPMSAIHLAYSNPPRKARRPLPSHLTHDESDNAEDSDVPDESENTSATASSKKSKKSRFPASSRSARDQARKTNHSKIEKRRREKINTALSELRTLVPAKFARQNAHDADDPESRQADKEFKLEILERTVAYVKHLSDRVAVLESENTSPCSCAGDPKRRRTSSYESHDSPSIQGISNTPSLPSISSWLVPEIVQLPSPPRSGRLQPAPEHISPPAFTLPSPRALPTSSSGSNSNHWTRADESAASVLVRISSTRSVGEIQTPSSLLKIRSQQ